MNRQRFAKRVREDAQTWRDRVIGKRITTGDPHIAAYPAWKCTDPLVWEPRIYLCQPIGKGLDKDLRYEAQPDSRLLQMPAEIRNRILELALASQTIPSLPALDPIPRMDPLWTCTSAVIFTCKQLYDEGRALAVAENTFKYEEFPKKTRFCATSREEYNYIWDL